MEISMNRPKSFNFRYLFFFICFCLLVLFTVNTSRSHAEKKHADTFTKVRSCISSGKPTRYFYDLDRDRYIGVCQINLTTFGFRIIEAKSSRVIDEKSAFIKENIRNADKLNKFIENRKWVEVFNKTIVDLFSK